MKHHAFVIEAEAEEGIGVAKEWARKELGIRNYGNPDVIVLRFGMLSVEEARRITEIAAGKPFAGENKVVVIAASRMYHEAQNALLKVFEEPPTGTFLFLIVPTIGNLLLTLRSRVQVLKHEARSTKSETNQKLADEFLKAGKEKRSAIIKRLTTGKDEEERRELRDEAIAIVNGIEAIAYASGDLERYRDLLADISVLRGYLHDRSAPIKMILEHLALVMPKQ